MKLSEKMKVKNRVLGFLISSTALFYLIYPWINRSVHNILFYDRCLFKTITGYPCPGCGYTRSIAALVNGDWTEAFRFNSFFPFLIALALLFLLSGIQLMFFNQSINIGKKTLIVIYALTIFAWIAKFIAGPMYY